MRTDKELHDIAVRIHAGQVFTSCHLPKERTELITSIFLPLALLNDEQVNAMEDRGVSLIFADMANAMPWGVNGFPTFSKCETLNEEEHERLNGFIESIKEALDGTVPE